MEAANLKIYKQQISTQSLFLLNLQGLSFDRNKLQIFHTSTFKPKKVYNIQAITVMSKKQEYSYNLKILLIGNSGVGKSCLLMRFSEDKFNSNLLNTIGVDFKVKMLDYGGEKIKLVLWDTAGQERFRTITNSYYRNANGIIIVYDITDRQSFENVVNWYDEMNKNINQKVGCVLVGNKLDMNSRRAVSYEEGLALANKYQIPFSQTSAKTSQNVNDLFTALTKQMMKLNEGTKSGQMRPPLPIKQTHEEEYCKCCEN